MNRYQSIMNQLRQELQNKYCTQEEFDILQKRLWYHSQNNTHQWNALLNKINSAATNLYLPLGKLTQILKNPIQSKEQKKELTERKTITGRKKVSYTHALPDTDKQIASSSWIEIEKVQAKKDEGKIQHDTNNVPLKQSQDESNSGVVDEQKEGNKKDALKAVETQNKEIVYYLPFPDKSGFFWHSKLTSDIKNSTAYSLRLPNQDSLTGSYTLVLENNKIITYAIGNESSFLEPVCDIVEKTGSQTLVIIEEGILRKQNNKWYPEGNKKLKIKII